VYRKLAAYLMLACLAGALAVARTGPAIALATFTLQGCSGPVSCFLTESLVPWLVGFGLIWAATFDPRRRYPFWVAGVKYLALVAALACAALELYREAARMGLGAFILSTQTTKGVLAAMAASQAPHGLLRIAGFSLLLTAPFFWLIRGARVAGLRRATYEAWIELKRLALPSLLLLVAAGLAESFLTPRLVAWLYR
jgi:hypothetical protein